MHYFYDERFDNRKFQYNIYKKPVINKQTDQKIISANSDMLAIGQVLSKEQEQTAFIKFNYFKYRIYKYVTDDKLSNIKRFNGIISRSKDLRNIRELLIKCNLRLIVKPAYNYSLSCQVENDEAFSVGVMSLFTCIDKFDFRLGFKFSTYFVNSIYKNLSSYFSKENRHTIHADNIDDIVPNVAGYEKSLEIVDGLDWINNSLDLLSSTEADIIKQYFGVCGSNKATVREIANQLGMSRQRINQIKQNAINKLKRLSVV